MLPTFAAECRCVMHRACSAPAVIYQYLPPAGHSAANLPHAAAAVDQWNMGKQPTVTQTLLCILCGHATHTLRAASIVYKYPNAQK